MKRIVKRTSAWREDQVYEVEVRVLRPPAPALVPVGGPAGPDRCFVHDEAIGARETFLDVMPHPPG